MQLDVSSAVPLCQPSHHKVRLKTSWRAGIVFQERDYADIALSHSACGAGWFEYDNDTFSACHVRCCFPVSGPVVAVQVQFQNALVTTGGKQPRHSFLGEACQFTPPLSRGQGSGHQSGHQVRCLQPTAPTCAVEVDAVSLTSIFDHDHDLSYGN